MKKTEFAKLVDATAVQFNMEEQEIRDLLELVNQYRFKAVAVMPEYWPLALRLLEEAGNTESIFVGGASFPEGTSSTEDKVKEIKAAIAAGAGELDFCNNVNFIKEGRYDKMLDDLKAVVDASEGIPTKVIIETPKLTMDEIKRASEIVVKSGATFVKSATGHFGATTLEHIKAISDTVGDSILIKAAGGIRDLKTVEAMCALGVARFGIGIRSIRTILDECED